MLYVLILYGLFSFFRTAADYFLHALNNSPPHPTLRGTSPRRPYAMLQSAGTLMPLPIYPRP